MNPFAVTFIFMALAEYSGARPHFEIPRYNKDGSYTQLGAWLEISRHVILIPKHSDDVQEKMASAKGMQIIPRPDGLQAGIALLSYPNVPIENPRRNHVKKVKDEGEPSDLEYFIDWFRYIADDGKENIIFAARVPQKGKTSRPPHTHGWNINEKPVYEHYFKLSAGDAYIGEEENKRLMKNYEAVPPNTNHYIEAGDEGVVLFMLLENVEGIPDDQIHIHR